MRNEERDAVHLRMPPNTLCQGSTKQDTVRENPPQAVPMEHNVCTGISDVRYFSPRLLAALTGILSSPLTVIEAPMGYGKTVAVREFLRRENLAVHSGFRAGFPGRRLLRRSLCREFERLPETAETARALRSLGPPFAPDDAARRDAALELLESLDFARPTVLVVDDVHLLASAPSCCPLFPDTGPAGHEQSAHRAHHPAFPNGRRPAIGPQGRARPPRPGPAGVFGRRHPGILRPVRPQDQPGTRSAPCMGPRADGSAAYICIAAITRNTGLFPCPPSPVLSPCPPRNLPPYLPRSIPRTNCHRIWPPFWKNSFIAHSPRTCGTCFSHSARWSSSPCRRRISAAARILGAALEALVRQTTLFRPPPGRERRVHRPRHIPEPAAALVPCTSTRTAAGRPPPLRRLVRGGGRIHSRDGALSRGARFRAGTFGHGTGHGPPSGHGKRRLLRPALSGLPGGGSVPAPQGGVRARPGRAFRVRLSGLCRPLPLAGALLRGAGRGASSHSRCCAANWKCCWPLRNTTTSRPCPSATAGHGNCWAAPRDCIRRNPPGAWAAPPCCSCSTGKAATSGRKSG